MSEREPNDIDALNDGIASLTRGFAALRDEVKRLESRSYGANKNIQNHEQEIGALRERVEALAKDAEHFRRFNAVAAEDLSASGRRIRKLESPAPPAPEREERPMCIERQQYGNCSDGCQSSNPELYGQPPAPRKEEEDERSGSTNISPVRPNLSVSWLEPDGGRVGDGGAEPVATLGRVLGESAPRKEEGSGPSDPRHGSPHPCPRCGKTVWGAWSYCAWCGAPWTSVGEKMPRPEAQGEKNYGRSGVDGDTLMTLTEKPDQTATRVAPPIRREGFPASASDDRDGTPKAGSEPATGLPTQGEKCRNGHPFVPSGDELICATCGASAVGPGKAQGEKCEHGYWKEYTCPKCPADWQRPAPSPGEKAKGGDESCSRPSAEIAANGTRSTQPGASSSVGPTPTEKARERRTVTEEEEAIYTDECYRVDGRWTPEYEKGWNDAIRFVIEKKALPRPEAQREKCYYCGDETAGVCDDHAEMTKTAADWNRTDDHPAPSPGEKARDDGQHRCGPECEDGCTLGGIAEKARERRMINLCVECGRWSTGDVAHDDDVTHDMTEERCVQVYVQQFPGETLAPFDEEWRKGYESGLRVGRASAPQQEGERVALGHDGGKWEECVYWPKHCPHHDVHAQALVLPEGSAAKEGK